MSLLERIFKRQPARPVNAVQMVNETVSAFSSYSGDAYANDIYRAAVDAIARNIGKLKGSHVISYADHDKVDGDCRINRILQVRPNPIMSAYDMLYKMATNLYLYNNSFALLERDARGNLEGVYPITATNTEMLSDAQGNLYVRFTLRSGQQHVFRYGDLIHLRRHFCNNELMGEDNGALYPALELAHTTNEGIISAIKAGASIRGILKFTTVMNNERLKEERDAFVASYLEIGNNGGVAVVDQKTEYIPIDNKPLTVSAEQIEQVQRKIYNYLGVTEKIVNSSYDENEFAAFYESVIEPFAVALSQECTSKIFSPREQAFGNSIMFESGRLQFTSNATKVNLIKELVPFGLLSINQCLEILNLPSVEGGDRRLQTLNVVDADRATEYQLKKTGGSLTDKQ